MGTYHAAAEELATDGDTTPYEKQILRKDGSHLGSLCATKRLSGSGHESECVEFILDVTERKRWEAEKARLESRDAAETAERGRISRELHDRVAHSMGVAHQSLQLHMALAESAAERAREKLAVAEETKNGVATALRTLLETSAPDGVDAEFSFSGDESLVNHDLRAQVYLVTREAMRNSLKH